MRKVTFVLFSVLASCSIASQAPEYPTRARALKDPNSIKFADANPALMRKLAKDGKFEIAQEASLAVNLAGEKAVNDEKDPENFKPAAPIKMSIPGREFLPGQSANGEILPGPNGAKPGGEGLPPGTGGGTMPGAGGGTMPGAGGGTMPGAGGGTMPGAGGGTMPGGEALPPGAGVGGTKPGSERLPPGGGVKPGTEGLPPAGPMTCQGLTLYITNKKNHTEINGQAKGTLHKSGDKHNERLVAHVQLPNAARLQVRFYHGNGLDALLLNLNPEDQNRYLKNANEASKSDSNSDLNYNRDDEGGDRRNPKVSSKETKADQEAYLARVREAAKTVRDFVNYDHFVDKIPKTVIDGREGYFLDNIALFPPNRGNMLDGRPDKIEIRALDFSGKEQGEKCEWKLKWKSPVVFDLHGIGQPETLSVFESDVKFDVAGDGVRVPTGWITPRFGFLALDKNNNGLVDGGEELFGEGTRLADGKRASDGYEALAQYDKSNQGYLNQQSPIFSKLKMWVDKNSDGVSSPDEIAPLSKYGITKISVNYTERPRKNWKDAAGNLVKFESKFFGPSHCGNKGCGTYDVFFATMPVAASK